MEIQEGMTQNYEILEHQPFPAPANTGRPPILMAWEPGNTIKPPVFIIWEPVST